MTSAKRPDGSVDYFAQHADKPAPNFVSPKGKASGGRRKGRWQGYCLVDGRKREKQPRSALIGQ